VRYLDQLDQKCPLINFGVGYRTNSLKWLMFFRNVTNSLFTRLIIVFIVKVAN
jgi:hypothetical protein